MSAISQTKGTAALDIEAIKKRRDWRQGRDLSQFELRLDDEFLAKHYAEDVTALIEELEALRDLMVSVEGLYVVEHGEPLADFYQPDSKVQGLLRRAGCYERGSRPGNGPLYLSPPGSEE